MFEAGVSRITHGQRKKVIGTLKSYFYYVLLVNSDLEVDLLQDGYTAFLAQRKAELTLPVRSAFSLLAASCPTYLVHSRHCRKPSRRSSGCTFTLMTGNVVPGRIKVLRGFGWPGEKQNGAMVETLP